MPEPFTRFRLPGPERLCAVAGKPFLWMQPDTALHPSSRPFDRRGRRRG